MDGAPPQRYLFIDLFRGAAVVLMLQGHVFRTIVNPSIQLHPLYQLHELFHGATAPAFLFGAGLTFVISTRKRWAEYHRLSPHFLRRVGRMFLVILLGVFLNLPYLSLRKVIAEGTADDFLQLARFDILHCIGVGLLFLQALVFLFKGERRFYGLVLTFTAAIPLLTPLVWDMEFLEFYPVVFAQAVNSLHGSPFPLFPFVGFLFAGVIVSWEFLHAAEQGESGQFIHRLPRIGVLFIVAGIGLDLLPGQLYPTYNFWHTSPNYFAIRVGVLLLLMAGFWYAGTFADRARSTSAFVRSASDVVTLLGKESLFVYVLHLVIIFGSVVNPAANLRQQVVATAGIGQAALIFAVILLGIVGLAYGWNVLKTQKPAYHRAVQIALAVVFLYVFLTREF
jgi:uncharacterized membrane protein